MNNFENYTDGSYKEVGKCIQCGSPIYGVVDGMMINGNIYICNCREMYNEESDE